jgi:hypothetical protein
MQVPLKSHFRLIDPINHLCRIKVPFILDLLAMLIIMVMAALILTARTKAMRVFHSQTQLIWIRRVQNRKTDDRRVKIVIREPFIQLLRILKGLLREIRHNMEARSAGFDDKRSTQADRTLVTVRRDQGLANAFGETLEGSFATAGGDLDYWSWEARGAEEVDHQSAVGAGASRDTDGTICFVDFGEVRLVVDVVETVLPAYVWSEFRVGA